MSTVPLIGVDFETLAIARRPAYPPKPVGFAVAEELGPKRTKTFYAAVSHPTGNDTTPEAARSYLADLWQRARRREVRLAFFHGKFDLDVAETALGLPRLPYDAWEDPLLLAFLNDPYEEEFGLKPLAEKYLRVKHAGRDRLAAWVIANVPEARKKKKSWGAYIARAPGQLVAPYARDDVAETLRLFRFYEGKVLRDDGMRAAYEREKRLTYPLIDAERRGVRIAARRLARDAKRWEAATAGVDRWLRRRLRARDLDVDSGPDLADALEKADAVNGWVYTAPTERYPGGQRSVATDALALTLRDPLLLHVFLYRYRLSNGLRTFARPWLAMADASGDDRIFTTWNQIRQYDENGRRAIGARTGRLSSTPNFQNISKTPGKLTFTKRDYRAEVERTDRTGEAKPLLLPEAFRETAPLPDLRGYVVPYEKGHVLAVRDFAQQELRILAHFEGATLLRAYVENPRLDQHEYARAMINSALGTHYTRKHVKNTGFGIIYAMGLALLAEKIDSTVEVARSVKAAYRQIFPGLEELEKDLRRKGRKNQPIRTHGGRIYYPEQPKVIKKVLRTFEYKLINTLIQGSAGDAMKETICAYDEAPGEGTWHLTVHDELVTSCPRRALAGEQARIRLAMDAMRFDVPMLSDGTYGATWSSRDLKKFKEAA